MVEKSRRKVVKFGSAAIGTALASSVGAAKPSNEATSSDSDTRIVEHTIVSESEKKSIGGVIVEKGDKRKYHFAIQDKENKTVSVAESNRSKSQ